MPAAMPVAASASSTPRALPKVRKKTAAMRMPANGSRARTSRVISRATTTAMGRSPVKWTSTPSGSRLRCNSSSRATSASGAMRDPSSR